MRLLSMALICSVLSGPPVAAIQGLTVIVIDGDEAANIVAEKIAAEPVIEVRDRDDRPVPGAIVRFIIRRAAGRRLRAVFGPGDSELRTLTDAGGRARAGALTPIEPGNYEIAVEVSHQGQTATTTIRHTNYATTAQAEAAGRKPGQSSGSQAASQGPGAAAQGTVAAAGGGLSKLAVVGLVVGGAAGAAGAAVALSRKDDDEAAPPASVSSITLSQPGGVQGASRLTFSVQIANFQSSSVTYQWNFGDGATSTEPAPGHVYSTAGTYTVSVTVSDGRQTVRAETTVTIYSVSGTWVTNSGDPVLQLTQSGTTVTGFSTWSNGPAAAPYSPCPITGSIQPGSAGSPVLIILNQPPCPHPVFANLVPMEYRLGMAVGGQILNGELILGPGLTAERRTGILLNRQ